MSSSKITIRRIPFASLEADWNRLYAARRKAAPFSDYSFARVLTEAYAANHMRHDRPVFYAFYQDGRVIMIAPLVFHYAFRKLRFGYCFFGFGAKFRTVSEDFLYADDMPRETMEKCIDLLVRRTGKLRLNFLPGDSLLCSVLKDRYPSWGDEINVAIPLPAAYEEYYANLGKSMRSNIHLSYNRLKTDGKEYSFRVWRGSTMPAELYDEFLQLYSVSYNTRWNHNRTEEQIRRDDEFVRHTHPHAVGMNCLDSSFRCTLHIDGKLAAVMGAYTQRDGDYLLVPRLAFAAGFERYSPGIMLLNEVIRTLIEDSHMPMLDLSKGEEQYKLWLGGQVYYQYGFQISRKK